MTPVHTSGVRLPLPVLRTLMGVVGLPRSRGLSLVEPRVDGCAWLKVIGGADGGLLLRPH